MRFYTKEWYESMQHLFYTSGMREIPDGVYTDADIRVFYEADLKEEIDRDRRCHDAQSGAPFDPAEMFYVDGEAVRPHAACSSMHFDAVTDPVEWSLSVREKLMDDVDVTLI